MPDPVKKKGINQGSAFWQRAANGIQPFPHPICYVSPGLCIAWLPTTRKPSGIAWVMYCLAAHHPEAIRVAKGERNKTCFIIWMGCGGVPPEFSPGVCRGNPRLSHRNLKHPLVAFFNGVAIMGGDLFSKERGLAPIPKQEGFRGVKEQFPICPFDVFRKGVLLPTGED